MDMSDLSAVIEEVSFSGDSQIAGKSWTYLKTLVESTWSCVAEVKIEGKRTLVKYDFKKIEQIVANFKELAVFLKTVHEKSVKENRSEGDQLKSEVCVTEFLVPLLILCGEHSEQNLLWSSTTAWNLSKEIQDYICKLWDIKNISDFMNGKNKNHQNVFYLCLSKLRGRLLKQTWKYYPAAVVSYRWLLTLMKFPDLNPHLPVVFPIALMLVEDSELAYQIQGVQCLRLIVKKTTNEELCKDGCPEVIWSALKPLLSKNEPELIIPLYSCALETLTAWEPQGKGKIKFTRHDEVVKTLLHFLETERNIELKRIYSAVIPELINHLGLACFKWIPQITAILLELMDDPDLPDETLRKNALKSVETLINLQWPLRVGSYVRDVLKILLNFVYIELMDDSNLLKTVEEELLPKTIGCLRLIKLANPEEVQYVCMPMLFDLPSGARFKKLITEFAFE